MKVSIITSCYNCEATIGQVIECTGTELSEHRIHSGRWGK